VIPVASKTKLRTKDKTEEKQETLHIRTNRIPMRQSKSSYDKSKRITREEQEKGNNRRTWGFRQRRRR
jgi:hypothetical protein